MSVIGTSRFVAIDIIRSCLFKLARLVAVKLKQNSCSTNCDVTSWTACKQAIFQYMGFYSVTAMAGYNLMYMWNFTIGVNLYTVKGQKEVIVAHRMKGGTKKFGTFKICCHLRDDTKSTNICFYFILLKNKSDVQDYDFSINWYGFFLEQKCVYLILFERWKWRIKIPLIEVFTHYFYFSVYSLSPKGKWVRGAHSCFFVCTILHFAFLSYVDKMIPQLMTDKTHSLRKFSLNKKKKILNQKH